MPRMDDSMLISANVGRRLGELRVAAGLSPRRVATKAGLRVSALAAIERGMGSPSVRALDGVARQLRVSLSQLIREAQEKPKPKGEELKALLARVGRDVAELPNSLGDKLAAVEIAAVRHAVTVCRGNQSAAARMLGLERKALIRRWNRIRRRDSKLN
jgi:transcriptional regulator with XRE-family HTH domain